jgi:hypothetical protein
LAPAVKHVPGHEVDSDSHNATTAFAHDFSRIPLHGGPSLRVHPKLTVNVPGDPFEREADEVSKQVMRMPEPQLKRSCACGGGECASCKSAQPHHEHGRVQTKQFAASDAGQTEAPPNVHEVLRSPGQPLDTATRAFFEPRFERDFSDVRIHRGPAAEEAARSINAQAFTVGSDVVFGDSPNHELLAHELTHVMQGGSVVRPYRKKGSTNFGACDGGGFTEQEFKDPKTQPWIKKIDILFSKATTIGSDLVADGTLTATYDGGQPAGVPALTNIAIIGGSAATGLTDSGTFDVFELQGCGYHAGSGANAVPKADRVGKDWPDYKHWKIDPADVQKSAARSNMSFPVFFQKKWRQAVHWGSMTNPSLSCVHVPFDNARQLNYHSRVNKTKVQIDYDATALQQLCCARWKKPGGSNPCHVNKSCP